MVLRFSCLFGVSWLEWSDYIHVHKPKVQWWLLCILLTCFIVVDISSSENHTMTSVTTWWQWFQTNVHCTNTNWPHWRRTDRLCWRHCSRYRLITRTHSLAWCSYPITAVILLKILCIFFIISSPGKCRSKL